MYKSEADECKELGEMLKSMTELYKGTYAYITPEAENPSRLIFNLNTSGEKGEFIIRVGKEYTLSVASTPMGLLDLLPKFSKKEKNKEFKIDCHVDFNKTQPLADVALKILNTAFTALLQAQIKYEAPIEKEYLSKLAKVTVDGITPNINLFVYSQALEQSQAHHAVYKPVHASLSYTTQGWPRYQQIEPLWQEAEKEQEARKTASLKLGNELIGQLEKADLQATLHSYGVACGPLLIHTLDRKQDEPLKVSSFGAVQDVALDDLIKCASIAKNFRPAKFQVMPTNESKELEADVELA